MGLRFFVTFTSCQRLSMYNIHSLSNGIKVVLISAAGPVCHCGVVVGAGTRDELPNEYGLAHFVEHTIFKGTDHRSAFHILNRLDEVGGELNAYTTKDETAVHASFLDQYFERAVELIADMLFCPSFPEREINKEKDVIVDEITSYEDSPSELIFDDFEDLAFAHTPLGHNILGSQESVLSFTGDDARRFINRTHSTDVISFAVYGDIPEQKVLRIAEKYLGSRNRQSQRAPRTKVSSFEIFEKTVDKDTHQGHVIIGSQAPDCHAADRLPMSVLSNLLGGPSMNSRLSVALREKHGIAYNIETNYTPFDDTGLFTVYFGTDVANIDRSLAIVRRELDRLCQSPLSEAQLAKILRQYTSQMKMNSDDGESVMLSAAKSVILYNQVLSIDEMCASVYERITAEGILDVARKTLASSVLSTLFYK